MPFIDLVEKRYSCRKFSDRIIEPGKLSDILEAARLAPTAVNAQPVRVLVLESPEALSRIRGLTRMAYDAPAVLMVCYDVAESYKASKYGDDHDCGEMDASIVATTMMMEAADLGIASLWARGFNASEIARAFGLPEKLKLVCLLDLGYADPDGGAPSPRHFVRKSLSEIVERL